MKITKQWLEQRAACREGREWFVAQGITEPVAGLRNLLNHGHVDWANWLVVRLLTPKQQIKYAVFAAGLI